MKQKSNNYFYIVAFYIILPIALAKLLWSVAMFFLDKDALEVPKQESFVYHYNINLAKDIIGAKRDAVATVEQIETNNRIDSIKLKGTYVSKSNNFIIIEDDLGTTFLYKNEKYMGYELIEIYDQRAVLEKDGRKYDIVLEDSDKKADRASSISQDKKSSASKATTQEEYIPGEPIILTREEIDSYIKDPNKIWKNIRIQELRKDGILEGFRVNYVKRKSFFDNIGLKSGDVIKSIDGKEIKSLADVMRYYEDVNNLEGLSISVLRGEDILDFEFNVN